MHNGRCSLQPMYATHINTRTVCCPRGRLLFHNLTAQCKILPKRKVLDALHLDSLVRRAIAELHATALWFWCDIVFVRTHHSVNFHKLLAPFDDIKEFNRFGLVYIREIKMIGER